MELSKNRKEYVSIILPVYNEERYIERCLKSIISQSYPHELMEILIVDGMSDDRTRELIEPFKKHSNIRILDNKNRIVTYALNLGIQNAKGDYIIRMDAHAEFPSDYVERCVYHLLHTNADNVGGIADTVGLGIIGAMNAEILSSKFGVGNSAFRTTSESAYVDTVPFGAFRSEVFEKVGLFAVDLPRSEDNDMNSRIRHAGGKVYLASDIHFKYFCRDSVKGLLKQALQNGNAMFITIRKNPRALSIRHCIPFLFVLSLLVMPLLSMVSKLFAWLFLLELLMYSLIDLYFSFSLKKRKNMLYKLIMYPCFHICYGVGSMFGIFHIVLY